MNSLKAQPIERTMQAWPSDEGVLLAENVHRTANEIAAALAAMRLVKSAGPGVDRSDLLDHAIDRLQGFAEVHLVLARPAAEVIDVSPALERLCRGLVAARLPANVGRVTLQLAPVVLPAATAHGLLLIAAELLTNAIRHAFVKHGGDLTVVLAASGNAASLSVIDTGQGVQSAASSAGTGHGGGIVAGLLDRLGGIMERRSDRWGTAVHVRLPWDACATTSSSGTSTSRAAVSSHLAL